MALTHADSRLPKVGDDGRSEARSGDWSMSEVKWALK